MARSLLMLDQLHATTKNYTVQVIVLEKAMAKAMLNSSSQYQRLLFQDAKGNKMQGMLYTPSIDIFAKSFKVHHTYAITNAPIIKTREPFCFLPNVYQIVPNGKTPVEEIKIDGLSTRALRYNFTPFSALQDVPAADAKIDVLFAILDISPRKQVKESFVCAVRAIDQSMVPITISLWDQFSLYEASAFASMVGTFPIVIGTRLKLSTYQGIGLATRGISGFVFSPTIPEAIALQTWCLAHAAEIRDLPQTQSTDSIQLNQATPDLSGITKIVNIPTAVAQDEYYNIKGTAQVLDFNQKFIYLACSICKRATNAYDGGAFWCNYCDAKVSPDAKMKIKMQITDSTGSIDVTIFGDRAEKFFDITSAELHDNVVSASLSLAFGEKLAEPRLCVLRIRAHMYSSTTTTQCTFNVVATYPTSPADTPDEDALNEPRNTESTAMTPQKRQAADSEASGSDTNGESDSETNEPATMKQKID